ncbi:TlpA family protein disulfide reductase [Halobacillus shinanisalinarum]|uniref:TlpA family protein disulfide reductase n=1 Tax=Halobacillus shinanisalinarum TaxID=2932258 RepID=A0ABY4H1R3_9BACI|nr:TlpA disulfide reductase family protein [Halobacillus shinanisalinarum]UOQ94269.1 TlpA family protein disulfide reductase [Halobacillus shinanisalinarum]
MKKAIDFQIPYINSNKTYQLNNDLGKVVILTFWTSWCPDCGVDLPKKEQLFQSIDREKVNMLTINVQGRERNDQDGKIFTDKFLTQPTLEDHHRKVYDEYNCEGVPTTIIINRDGYVTHQFGDKASFLTIVEAIGTLI